jgi:glutamate racemase
MQIGFFDSGLGGLTILRAVARALPQYDYSFYGDTAHLPYGDKTEEEIYQLSQAAMAHLFGNGCALVIIACNTASAETLRRLQDEWLPVYYPDRRILGVIIPTIEALVASGSRRALLLATKRTVSSQKYERELSLRGDARGEIVAHATPGLVPLIEAGELEAAVAMAWNVLEPQRATIDTVILGCTHYTELKVALRERLAAVGVAITVLSQDEIIPEKLQQYLRAHPEIAERLTNTGLRSIHLTAHRPDYDRIAAQLLHGAFVGE